MTKPPVCWLRWRGKPISSRARRMASRKRAVARVEPHLAEVASSCTPSADHHQIMPDSAPIISSDSPSALPTSRMALFAAVGNDGGDDGGAVAAVFLVDVLDDLLAPLVLEIDVDVGRLVALGGDEALEQQVDIGGVHGGDAEAVADGGIGRRAAPLAEDVLACGQSGRYRGR